MQTGALWSGPRNILFKLATHMPGLVCSSSQSFVEILLERPGVIGTGEYIVIETGELYHINPFGELKPCVGRKEVLSVMEEFHDSAFGGH